MHGRYKSAPLMEYENLGAQQGHLHHQDIGLSSRISHISARQIEGASLDEVASFENGGAPHETPVPNTAKQENVFVAWSLELLAAALSVGAIIAALGLLLSQDGRLLSSWGFITSLNTVVSVLGTIAKASLLFALSACIGQQKWNWFRSREDQLRAFELFDEASRGPWGSVRLLVWLKGRHWAALGASATIILLLFDPFLQALILYPGSLNNISLERAPNIAASNHMDLGSSVRGLVEMSVTGDVTDGIYIYQTRPDVGIVAATYTGFDNSSDSLQQTAKFNCGTGNCTWPVFTSLGVCSSCSDVTAHIRTRSNSTSHYTQYSVGNTAIDKWDSTTSKNLGFNATVDPSQTITVKHADTLLLSVVIIRAADSYLQNLTKWEYSLPTATECSLSLCVKAFNSTVTNGVLHEDVVGSWINRIEESWQPLQFDGIENTLLGDFEIPNISKWPKPDNRSLYEFAGTGRTDLQLAIPDNVLPGVPDTQFNATYTAVLSLITFLLEVTVGRPKSQDWYSAVDLKGYRDIHRTSNQSIEPVLDMEKIFFNSKNLGQTFESVATTLTNQIRNNLTLTPAGNTEQWTLYIKVNWRFVIVPALGFFVGYLYIFLVIFETHKARVPAWKESAYPSLANGLDDKTQEQLRTAERNEQSSIVKRKMKITFNRDGDGDDMRLLRTSDGLLPS